MRRRRDLLIRALAVGLALAWTACDDPANRPVEPEDVAEAPAARDTAFADAALGAAVREALQAPTGPLTAEALLGLTRLSARGRDITTLRGIERLARLTVLDLAENRVGDLSPLAALTGLTFLDLEWNRVSNVAPLSGLSDLEFLGLGHNRVEDISPLRGLRRLRSVALEGNPLSAASRSTQVRVLKARGVQVSLGDTGLAAQGVDGFEAVWFADYALEQVVRADVGKPFEDYPGDLVRADVQSLPGLTAVRKQIADLRGIEAMTGLLSLNVTGNAIADLSPLAGLTRLRLLSAAENQIDDLSPLSQLAALTFLNIDGNRVRDLSPLAALSRLNSLYAENNQISDLSPLLALPALKKITLAGNPLSEASLGAHVAALRARGVDVSL